MESDREAFTLILAAPRPWARAAQRSGWSAPCLRPLGERRYDEEGDLVASFTYGSWEGRYPHRIVVGRPREGYEAEFSFEKADVNVAVPDRAFVPRTPADYKVVEVGS